MTRYTKAGVLAAFFWLSLTGMQVYAEQSDEPIDTTAVEESVDSQNNPDITYYSHVSNIGDTEEVENGDMTGTEGRGLQMEALTIELDSGDYTGDIEYSAHVENIGWMDYVSSGQMAGTTGKGLQIEAVKIRLTDQLAENYDIYYQAHIEDYGWLGWASNNQSSGSAGYGKQMEALKILLQRKGADAPVSKQEIFIANQLNYQAHVSNVGWMNPVNEDQMAGTTGRGNSIEALKIELDNAQYEGNIEYAAYVHGIGWQDYVSDGEEAGTVGEATPIEAVKIRLSGDIADHYDIYYRVHSSNIGWQGWTSNDNAAGTIAYGEHIEALQIRLVSPFELAPIVSDNSFYANNLNYQAHVSNIGWMDEVNEAQLAGTTGKGYGIEALKISANNIGGEILYKSYSKSQWDQDWKSQNEITGTTGEATPLEAIQIKLSDTIASLYDVFYRVHVGGLGWLDWVCNGAFTGTVNQGKAIEAIEITLDAIHTVNTNSTITYGENEVYYIKDTIAQGWEKINGDSYYFDNGYMITNQVVDGRALGPDGKEIVSPALAYARDVLNAVGWNLRAGYEWVLNNFTYQKMAEDPTLGSDWYAQYGFENRQGNCYAFAAAVYEMGLLLGYDIHQVAGTHLTSAYGPIGHSWLEVIVDDILYIVDPDFEKELGRNGYFVTYGASGTLRYYEWNRMN